MSTQDTNATEQHNHEVGDEVFVYDEKGAKQPGTVTKVNKATIVVMLEDGETEVRVKPSEVEPMGDGSKMAGTLAKYRKQYVVSVAASGRKSLSTGDQLAILLEALEPATTMRAAEIALGLEKGEVKSRYARLNRGQQRMNAGNRLRAGLKRGDLSIPAIESAIKDAKSEHDLILAD